MPEATEVTEDRSTRMRNYRPQLSQRGLAQPDSSHMFTHYKNHNCFTLRLSHIY